MTREEAKDFLFDMSNLIGTTAIEHWTEKDAEKMRQAVLIIENESAQPEPHYDEWCTDCKEYDHERHCCPRWNRVIRETLKDAQPNTDHIYAELSKVYNVKGLPDEAIGIIGDLMLSLDGPSAQPDNRLSKIAALVEGTIDHFDLDDAMDLLYQIKDVLDGSDELPSAQPEPKWIPCSERLPEEDGLYLVTTSIGQVQMHVFNHNGNSAEYWRRCNKAWMPLPEPYKGGELE